MGYALHRQLLFAFSMCALATGEAGRCVILNNHEKQRFSML